MSPNVGDLLVGKVLEIRPNGAVISLPGDQTGFLHISEISEEAVTRVEDHLREGQELVLKVIGFDRLGRPSLSLSRVTPRDREALEYHREVVQMRSVLAGRSLHLPEEREPKERIEWRLARWLEEAEAALARLRRRRAKRLSEHFYTEQPPPQGG
ncbi:S1 RNA-binding domain-containing protein [Candidatus Bipolaricaulota bacterium]|nr:S1 RNA-binding domain-containing protein [Candidatus Bipolaricaulota bacterium]